MLEEFKLVGKKLFEEGLITSHGGNMSVRQGDKIFITAHGSMLSELKDEDIIEVSLAEGDPNDGKASCELVVHRAIYKGSKAQAIVHAHPAEAIALSIQEDRIIPQDAEGRFYTRVVPVVKPKEAIASAEAGRELGTVFNSSYRAAMIRGHGSFVIGENLLDAYKVTSALAASAKIIVALKMISRPIPQSAPRKEDPYKKRSVIPTGIGIMGRRMPYHKR